MTEFRFTQTELHEALVNTMTALVWELIAVEGVVATEQQIVAAGQKVAQAAIDALLQRRARAEANVSSGTGAGTTRDTTMTEYRFTRDQVHSILYNAIQTFRWHLGIDEEDGQYDTMIESVNDVLEELDAERSLIAAGKIQGWRMQIPPEE